MLPNEQGGLNTYDPAKHPYAFFCPTNMFSETQKQICQEPEPPVCSKGNETIWLGFHFQINQHNICYVQ